MKNVIPKKTCVKVESFTFYDTLIMPCKPAKFKIFIKTKEKFNW